MTPITRSVHCKFNCITVALDRTSHGFYIFQNVNRNALYKTHFILSFYKQNSSSSNVNNTFDDLFRHTYMSPITHTKIFLGPGDTFKKKHSIIKKIENKKIIFFHYNKNN